VERICIRWCSRTAVKLIPLLVCDAGPEALPAAIACSIPAHSAAAPWVSLPRVQGAAPLGRVGPTFVLRTSVAGDETLASRNLYGTLTKQRVLEPGYGLHRTMPRERSRYSAALFHTSTLRKSNLPRTTHTVCFMDRSTRCLIANDDRISRNPARVVSVSAYHAPARRNFAAPQFLHQILGRRPIPNRPNIRRAAFRALRILGFRSFPTLQARISFIKLALLLKGDIRR
jgi:hypothetical protein